MAAASNAAPVHSPLGANAADDAVLVGTSSLFAAVPVFLALDDPQQWSLSPFPVATQSEGDAPATDAFLIAPDDATSERTVDLLPMLLSALDEERVESARTSFGHASQPTSPVTLLAGYAERGPACA